MAADGAGMCRKSAAISSGAANIAHITMFVCSSTGVSPPQQMHGASGCCRSTQYWSCGSVARHGRHDAELLTFPTRSAYANTQQLLSSSDL